MSNYQGDDAEYMADEYDIEDIDDDVDEQFRGRYIGGSDSEFEEFEYSARSFYRLMCRLKNLNQYLLLLFNGM